MQSRYYNPEWGRFINADGYGGRVGELLSHNLFAYCSNNPVMRIDPDGYDWMDKLISSLLGETYVVPSQSQKMWEAFYAGVQSSINSFAQDISNMFSDVCRFAASADRISEMFENMIVTPYGDAIQDYSQKALNLKINISTGGYVYRAGTLGRSNISNAQFWASENPLNPGFADRYGVDFTSIDYIIRGRIRPGSDFITRPAPGLGNNMGGGIEAVTNPYDIIIDSFFMP